MKKKCEHLWKIYRNGEAHEKGCNTFYCQKCLKEVKKK